MRAPLRWKNWAMHPAAKPLLFVLCLLPFVYLLAGAVQQAEQFLTDDAEAAQRLQQVS